MHHMSVAARLRAFVLTAVTLGAATLLLVPSASAAPIVLDAAGAKTLSNLQQLALAAQGYEATFGRLPSDYRDATGTAILSWRVALLPFLGEATLFGRFDPTRAWDDPTNLPLLSLMPDAFRSPSSPAGSTTSDYAGAVGAGTVFAGGPGPKLADITDGTSNTILFGEAIGSAIPWTRPGDIAVGSCPALGGTGFSSSISGAVPFAFVDGSVGLLADGVSCDTLLAFLVRNDGVVTPTAALVPFVTVVPEPPALALLFMAAAVVMRRRQTPVAAPARL
jgi:hypothetical protein